MRRKGETMAAPATAPVPGLSIGALALLACSVALTGCAAMTQLRGANPPSRNGAEGPSPAGLARAALAAGNLEAADAVLGAALAPVPSDGKSGDDQSGLVIRGTAITPDLLVLRAELRVRQGRYPEADSDALTAMALVPATLSAEEPPPGEPPGPRDERDAEPRTAAVPRSLLTQRSIHLHMALLYEDAGRDDSAEQHLEAARELCADDPVLVERRDCEFERDTLVRIRIARGHYAEAESLVLAEIADVQSRYGAYDIRLSLAFCDVARFYARQGKYTLSGPLYARSFDLWNTAHEDAFAEYSRALAAGEPSPFDVEFLTPRAGHAPFSAPCGLEDQGVLLYKLGEAGLAGDALHYEQQLWAADTEADKAASASLDALVARAGDPLDIASARHAVAFVALEKGDTVRAERELRLAIGAYAAAWTTLALSDRRFRVEDYLGAIESLVELQRSSRRFPEAIDFGERARDIAAANVDAYDSVRLDTLLSLAKTFREMRDPQRAETAAGRYLDAVVQARGDTSADYAWALRTISFAYLLREEIDASQRMEMQAKAIWAKQNVVAPEFVPPGAAERARGDQR